MLQPILRSLKDLQHSLSVASVLAGLVATLTGYSGPLVLVLQAAEKAKLDTAHTSSWIWSVSLGCGICALLLSLYYRKPVLVAWPTAGTALLISSIARYSYSDAIGAFIIVGIALFALGISKLFGRVIEYIPKPVISGMLAGVLLKFGLGVFTQLALNPIIVLPMLVTYFLLKRVGTKAPAIGTLLLGLLIAFVTQQVHLENVSLQLTQPVFTLPTFSWQAVVGLSLPMFVIALTSQNAPGTAVLRNAGYTDFKPDGAITLTGAVGALSAVFGSHGLSIAAITAAICTSPEAHPDPNKRYSAGVAYGFWYILFGLFGATAVALFSGLPKALTAAIAGLAIMGAIIANLTTAMQTPNERDGGVVALLLTVSDVTLLGIGAPFWGLVFGLLTNALLNARRKE